MGCLRATKKPLRQSVSTFTMQTCLTRGLIQETRVEEQLSLEPWAVFGGEHDKCLPELPLEICIAGFGPRRFALNDGDNVDLAASRVDSSVQRDAQTCDTWEEKER